MNGWEGLNTPAGEAPSPISKSHSFLKLSFSIFGVFVLFGGVFMAVMATQQSTEQRSRAYDGGGSYGGGGNYDGGRSYDSGGSYGGGGDYDGRSSYDDGGYNRDSYDGGSRDGGYNYDYNTGTAPVQTKTYPTPTPIKSINPTLSWVNLLFKTPTPIKIPTPTKVPTSINVPTTVPAQPLPTALPQHTSVPQPTPTDLPGFESTPEPTNIPEPTEILEPTPTPAPDDTVLALTLGLHGIGNAGENLNATAVGNETPQRAERMILVEVYDIYNKFITSHQQSVVYDDYSGMFEGAINLGRIDTGSYTVKVKTDQYLSSRVSREYIANGEMNDLPTMVLRGGDVNSDDKINILDYNVLAGCYSDLLPAVDCYDDNNIHADLNDDGKVNQFDYNFFLRELSSNR